MKKRKKCRWWIMLLTIGIIFGVVMPISTVWADGDNIFDSGTGSESDPFIISTAKQLYSLSVGQSQYLGSHFQLGADIDFASWDWEGQPWVPIGNDPDMFTGSFDGNGYKIKNLYIDMPRANVGMFGVINGAMIKHVILEEVQVRALNIAGALVGRNVGGSVVQNSSASGKVEGMDTLGGLVGYNGATSIIQSSSSAVHVKGNNNIGGILGSNHYYGTVQSSFTSGKVEGNDYVGGLAGETYSSIQSSYSTSDVTGSSRVGGLIGIFYSDPGRTISVDHSYAAGKVQGGMYSGGLIGYTSSGRSIVQSSYWNSSANLGKNAVGGGYGTYIGLIGLTEEQMKNQSSFIDFDFEEGWAILEGVDYPYLKHSTQLNVRSSDEPIQFSQSDRSYRMTLEGSFSHILNQEKLFSLHLKLSNEENKKVADGVFIERITGDFKEDVELVSFLLDSSQTLESGTYTLWIWAQNAAHGTSPISLKLEIVSTVPEGVKALAGDEEVMLEWDAVLDADSYNVYQYAGDEAVPDPTNLVNWSKVVNEAQGTKATVSELTNGIGYNFVVTSQRNGVESDFSEVIRATPQAPPSVDAGLSMIYLDGKELSGFHLENTSYTLDVPYTNNQITITADVNDDRSTYIVKGNVTEGENQALEVGENAIEVIVTAENQVNTATYSININRLKSPSPPSSGGGGSGGGGGSIPTLPNERSIPVNTASNFTLNEVHFDIPLGATSDVMKIKVETVASNGLSWDLPSDTVLSSNIYEITKNIGRNFNQPITIALPFDLKTYPLDQYTPAVYWLDEENNEWIMLDDVRIDEEKGTVKGKVNHFTKFAVLAKLKKDEKEKEPVQPPALLRDITGHWAEDEIVDLVQRGVIRGYEDGTFRPDQPITRAEFTAILMQILELKESEGDVFADTATHWAKGWIATAYKKGIINGYSKSMFGPNDSITREQMAVMLDQSFSLIDKNSSLAYTDRGQISIWAMAAVERASAAGILLGYKDGSIRPQANATRAEAVTVLLRALSETGI